MAGQKGGEPKLAAQNARPHALHAAQAPRHKIPTSANEPSVIKRKLKISAALTQNPPAAASRLSDGTGAASPFLAALAPSANFFARAAVLMAASDGGAAAPIRSERLLALDEAARDIICHRRDDTVDIRALCDQDAALPGVLKKPIRPAVMPEIDKADHIDEQSRAFAMDDAGVEQFDVLGRLIQDRPDRVREQFEPHDLGLTQVVHGFALFSAFDPRTADGLLQARGNRLRCSGLLSSGLRSSMSRLHLH